MVLVAEDGKRFHGHRLVLCAQSPVFKTMLDSDLWAASRDKEVSPTNCVVFHPAYQMFQLLKDMTSPSINARKGMLNWMLCNTF